MSTMYAPLEAPWLATDARGTIAIQRWPAERPLFVLATIISVLMWFILTITIVGIAYAAMFGLFFFFIQAVFVAHVRGNGVRLGPDQFPELYARVQEIGRRMGMEQVPDAYLMQAGGALNAFATRFLRRHIIVLFSDLLEACGDDHGARDMIIGHELGHVHAGHLRWHWFLLPSNFVPFLGPALSRAREYTCDRYGRASAGSDESAQLGLAILAAGGRYGRLVNRQALVRQRTDLATGWMTIGRWLSSHPPLAHRLLALDPELGEGHDPSGAGTLRAAAIVGVMLLPVFAVLWIAGALFATRFTESLAEARSAAEQSAQPVRTAEESEELLRQLEVSVQTLGSWLQEEAAQGRGLPADQQELTARWGAAYPEQRVPFDPFDGLDVGYYRTANGYILWSVGPDGEVDTADDLEYAFDARQ